MLLTTGVRLANAAPMPQGSSAVGVFAASVAAAAADAAPPSGFEDAAAVAVACCILKTLEPRFHAFRR